MARGAPGIHCARELLAERLGTALLERGLRLTTPRRALVACIAARASAAPASAEFTPAELLADCQTAQPGVVSRATVYRTLDLLVEAKLAQTCDGANGPDPSAAQQCYRLSPEASAEVRLLGNDGQQRLVAANPELVRVLRTLCRRSGFTLGTFTVEIKGDWLERKVGKPRS